MVSAKVGTGKLDRRELDGTIHVFPKLIGGRLEALPKHTFRTGDNDKRHAIPSGCRTNILDAHRQCAVIDFTYVPILQHLTFPNSGSLQIGATPLETAE